MFRSVTKMKKCRCYDLILVGVFCCFKLEFNWQYRTEGYWRAMHALTNVIHRIKCIALSIFKLVSVN